MRSRGLGAGGIMRKVRYGRAKETASAVSFVSGGAFVISDRADFKV